jgi:hypothetical protein
MTISEINRQLAALTNDVKQTDEAALELQLAAEQARRRAKDLKERSDSLQRKLAASL